MPVLFVGHGSPMNAIEDNEYSKTWKELSKRIDKPKAILSISAHWFTNGTKIMNNERPETIYDMYGFPKELYEITYNVEGSPHFAESSKKLISKESRYDSSWGIDHGTWSVLVHMYPERNIPVFQMSIDATALPRVHYVIGQEIKALRQEGVLIFATGNIVHNLRLIDWNKIGEGFDWAYEFDDYVHSNIKKGNHDDIIEYNKRCSKEIAKLAVPTTDHYYPLLYALGASDEDDKISVYNKSCELGSISMTTYLWE